MGSKKTTTSAEPATKTSFSTRDPVSKEASDRKKCRTIFEATSDKKKSSDRKKSSRHKSSAITPGYASKSLNEKEDIEKNKSTNDSDQENIDSDSDYDEEEKWLNAVESGDHGKLEKIDSELKNIKDPKLMTARQRAMISGTGGR